MATMSKVNPIDAHWLFLTVVNISPNPKYRWYDTNDGEDGYSGGDE